VSHMKYELGRYIPEDDILHSDRRENLKSYILDCTGVAFSMQISCGSWLIFHFCFKICYIMQVCCVDKVNVSFGT
jgi:hypothetical protein